MPEGAFYGQEATMPEAPKPARCCCKGKTGAFYGQEATMPEGAFYGQEAASYKACFSASLEFSQE
jgi:hypothetical protein